MLLEHLRLLAETAHEAVQEHAPEVVEATHEATESSGGIGALGIDLKSLILQIVTFLVLFLVLKKFAFGPIVNLLEERRRTIDESLKNAEAIKVREAKSQEESETILAQAREKADEIIAEGHAEAGALIKEAEDKATAKAETIVQDAHGRIEREFDEAKKELKGELLGLVSQATETVIEEKLDADKDAKLLKKALSQEVS